MADRYILGTVISDHDSAACLLKNGRLVAAVGEERICRIKRGDDRNSIRRAMQYVLAEARIPVERLDLIVTDCDHYYPPGGHPPVDVFPDFLRKQDVVQLNHHVGHVASAFFPSPFDEAAVLTVDASGGIAPIVPDKRHWGLLGHEIAFRERGMTVAHVNPTLDQLLADKPGGEARNYPAESLTLNHCRRGEVLRELENYYADSSLGYFYAIVSHFLDMEEGSFMGLSSHGAMNPYYDAMCDILRLKADGRISINPEWMCFWEGTHVLDDPVHLKRLKPKFFETFGKPRKFSDEISQRDKDFAWAAQTRLEEAMVHVGRHLHEITGTKNLCIGGGVGLNSVANHVVLEKTPFEHIFIQPAASDDGIALGNALFGHYVLENLPKRAFFDMGSACLGREYPEEAIEDLLDNLDQSMLRVQYVPSLPFIDQVEILFRTETDGEFVRRNMEWNIDSGRYEKRLDISGANFVEYSFEVRAAQPLSYTYRPPTETLDAGPPDARFVACEVHAQPEPKDEPVDPFAKFLYDHHDLAGVLDGQRAFIGPEHVVIDPTNRCDNNCIGCWTRSPLLGDNGAPSEWRRQEMGSERLLSLIDELAGMHTRRIRFTGGGEPFMHPGIMDALRRVKEHGMIAAVTTNFSALKDNQVAELAELGIEEFTVSLWAGTAPIYARSHPNKSDATFGQIERNLKLLCSRKPAGSKVILANVIFSMNFQETREMLDFALRVGADGIYFTLIDSVHALTDGLLLNQEHVSLLQDHMDQVRRRVEKVNANERPFLLDNFHGFLRRIRSVDVTTGDYDRIAVDEIPCYIGWIFCRVLPNGDISPCCRGVNLPMGNITDRGFADVWSSPTYREFRRMALTKKKNHPYFKEVGCYRTCDNLMHNEMVHERMKRMTELERQQLIDFLVKKL